MNVLRVIVNLFQFNRTNWKAVALCFIAASVFWLFSALNKEGTANLRFPLSFEFDRERYIPVELPQDVAMNVSGNGWDLFRRTIRINLSPLIITIDRPDLRKIPASVVESLVSGQMSSIQINYVQTDTLFVHIEPRTFRKFKVEVDIGSVAFKENYRIVSPIIVLPDSIELEGPLSEIDAISPPILVNISESNLDQNFREELAPEIRGESITVTPSSVEVMFEVGEIIDIEKRIRLDITSLSSRARVMSDSVTCLIRIPRKYEDDVNAYLEDARAVLPTQTLQRGENRILPRVEGLPPFSEIVRIDTLLINL